jgi:hypothetical protein
MLKRIWQFVEDWALFFSTVVIVFLLIPIYIIPYFNDAVNEGRAALHSNPVQLGGPIFTRDALLPLLAIVFLCALGMAIMYILRSPCSDNQELFERYDGR